MKPSLKTEKLILSRMVPDKKTGCWIWTGCLGRKGYGVLTIQQRFQRAHRVAYEVWRGPIPQGMQVLHRCDRPQCVNPDHLFLGTNGDNIRDSISKGRWLNKVTGADVVKIKSSKESIRSIGKKFGITKETARRIKNGTQGYSLP